jgi:hypothetical protein
MTRFLTSMICKLDRLVSALRQGLLSKTRIELGNRLFLHGWRHISIHREGGSDVTVSQTFLDHT